MNTKSKSSRAESLLAAIQRKAPDSPAPTPEQSQPAALVRPEPGRKAGSRVTAPRSRVGKPAQFWLHDEDRRLIRELAAWLAGQGLRPTDSMVIRSALRTAKTGGELLEAYRQASQLDGRLKQHKTE
jgi:hypothetical protein